MQLRHYLQKHRITMAAFGQLFDPPLSAGKVNHWLRGTRRVSLDEALQIEVLTDGEVTPRDLAGKPVAQASAREAGAAHA